MDSGNVMAMHHNLVMFLVVYNFCIDQFNSFAGSSV